MTIDPDTRNRLSRIEGRQWLILQWIGLVGMVSSEGASSVVCFIVASVALVAFFAHSWRDRDDDH